MKNSSVLLEKIAQNFTRSSSGTCGSSASCSTRSLNCTVESSRLKYSSGAARSTVSTAWEADAWTSVTGPPILARGLVGGRCRAVVALGHGVLQARAITLALVLLPRLQKAREQKLATGAQVDEQRHQTGVVAAVHGLAHGAR